MLKRVIDVVGGNLNFEAYAIVGEFGDLSLHNSATSRAYRRRLHTLVGSRRKRHRRPRPRAS